MLSRDLRLHSYVWLCSKRYFRCHTIIDVLFLGCMPDFVLFLFKKTLNELLQFMNLNVQPLVYVPIDIIISY